MAQKKLYLPKETTFEGTYYCIGEHLFDTDNSLENRVYETLKESIKRWDDADKKALALQQAELAFNNPAVSQSDYDEAASSGFSKAQVEEMINQALDNQKASLIDSIRAQVIEDIKEGKIKIETSEPSNDKKEEVTAENKTATK